MPPTITEIATPIGVKKHAAIVLIPGSSVTGAEARKISMEETIMFVANLVKIHQSETELDEVPILKDSPEEEKNGVGDLSPTSTNDLKPSVSVGGVKFEFCRKLMGSPQF